MTLPQTRTDPPIRLLSAFNDLCQSRTPAYLVQIEGREMWVAASLSDTADFTLYVPDLERRVSFSRRSARSQRTLLRRPLPKWARYAAGIVIELADERHDLTVDGLEAVFVGAEAPGPRYDFSLGLALAALLHTIHDRPYTLDRLVDLVEAVRRGYVERG